MIIASFLIYQHFLGLVMELILGVPLGVDIDWIFGALGGLAIDLILIVFSPLPTL